jgi:leucyl aminopeptidase (aminopeptidase T)
MANLSVPAAVAVNQCLGVKQGEVCLVITDEPCRSIGRALFDAAVEAGAETMLLEMLPRQIDGEEPPPLVAGAMYAADVIFCPTFRSLSHTAARIVATERGARIATLPGITEETMLRALSADYDRIDKLSRTLADLLTEARGAHLTTAKGTDLRFNLEGRSAGPDTGILRNPGDFGNLPAGEAYIAPLEGMTEGLLIIDGAIGDSGVLSGETIEIKVQEGYAVAIRGGKAARMLEASIAPYGREARNIAELGIGANERAKLIGNILEDEKVLGTVHVALGKSKALGGLVDVPVHLDGVVLEPTLEIDGFKVLDRGRMLLE